jgi:hypothetical protein
LSSKVQRLYATDGNIEFLHEAYQVSPGVFRSRLSPLVSWPEDFAIGTGTTPTEAIDAAWAAYQETTGYAFHCKNPRHGSAV